MAQIHIIVKCGFFYIPTCLRATNCLLIDLGLITLSIKQRLALFFLILFSLFTRMLTIIV